MCQQSWQRIVCGRMRICSTALVRSCTSWIAVTWCKCKVVSTFFSLRARGRDGKSIKRVAAEKGGSKKTKLQSIYLPTSVLIVVNTKKKNIMSQCNSPLSPGAVVFFESYLHVVTDVALVLKVSHFVLLCMSCAALISVSEQHFYEQMIVLYP